MKEFYKIGSVDLNYEKDLFRSGCDLYAVSANLHWHNDGGLIDIFGYLFPDLGGKILGEARLNSLKLGDVTYLEKSSNPKYVAAMITTDGYAYESAKNKSSQETIYRCLMNLRKTAEQLGVKTIAIPSIGCGGHTKMDPNKIYHMVIQVFFTFKGSVQFFTALNPKLEEEYFENARNVIYPYSYYKNLHTPRGPIP